MARADITHFDPDGIDGDGQGPTRPAPESADVAPRRETVANVAFGVILALTAAWGALLLWGGLYLVGIVLRSLR